MKLLALGEAVNVVFWKNFTVKVKSHKAANSFKIHMFKKSGNCMIKMLPKLKKQG